MPRRAFALMLLSAAVVMSGCARGPANPERAKTLVRWLGEQSYSTYSMFRHRGRTPEQPPSPDGLTLGSPNVFAAIGCNPKDLMSLDVFWADQRTVRPLAKPMTVAVVAGEREEAVADFPEQTLRRVRHTAISVSQAEKPGLRVSCVDFAPMRSQDSFLARWFLVENTGQSAGEFRLKFKLGAAGEWKRKETGVWLREGLAFVSDVELVSAGEELEAVIGRLQPGEAGAAAVLVVAAKEVPRLSEQVARAKAALIRLQELLDETKSDWQTWCARVPLQTGDERRDDLLDSLLCLVRSHIGAEAIHTGSLHYPHNRAWVRDSYWVQRALLELGRKEEAKLSLGFFHRAWRTSGVASYYEIPSGRSTAYGYGRVELPHYLVLMVRDAARLGGVNELDYWDMVRGCLDSAALPPSGLQPMNGDETWLLAAPVRELDDLLDNSWLLIASAEYGAKLAEIAGDSERAARYGALAYRARLALTRLQPGTGEPPWYAIGRGGDGSLDFSLCPEVFARGVILGVLPASDPYLRSGLWESWKRMQFGRGIRAHARSATISGGTPGYVLSAAAQMELPLDQSLLDRLFKFCSATGCVWEFHDLYDPAWGGEKRRLWDSAVVLMGLVHTLFEVRQAGGSVELLPRPLLEPRTEIEQEPPPVLGARDAAGLLARAGPALILEDQSPEHAARLARELLRHTNKQYRMGTYTGEPPRDHSAIIVAPSLPPPGWTAGPGYWVRKWEGPDRVAQAPSLAQSSPTYPLRRWQGPPQVWVRNAGDVYQDTDLLLDDLLSYLTPQREQPLPFPDANFDLVSRYGEPPAGEAEVIAVSGSERASARLKLAGERVALKLGSAEFSLQAAAGEGNLLKLTVTAPGGRAQPADIAVTLPAGWWLVFARDMTGKWDRVESPVSEVRLPDGRVRLLYSFRPGQDTLSLTFDLARLRAARP